MRNAAFYVGFLLWTGAASAEIDGLREPADFAGIADATERSVAIFEEMSKVITHPRCINCHPIEGGPRQGDDMRPHVPPRNGGRSLEDIHHHHLTDALVLNSWRTHGVGRTPLPGNPEVFAELTRAWIDTGAACPD
jgi:hypothetical protein